MSLTSSIYAGTVVHTRLRPKKHNLRYSVFSLLLDLDELAELDSSLRLFGVNRRGLFSFWEKDHGDGISDGLKAWVTSQLSDAGINTDELNIRVLCYPRIFGYVFNPLTVYFCYGVKSELRAVIYEVCNTFHERHAYIIPADGEDSGQISHSCNKDLYVSPFVPMDCRYDFSVRTPAEQVRIAIKESDADGMFLYAMFQGRHAPLTDRNLAMAFLKYPLMTLKVTAAIHWEALRLWLKRVPVHRHARAASPRASTIVAHTPRTETR
ncbi:DUF1365 domain-containing protein [Rhizobium wenxiniae]|uniref:DUF1365 domain-containing protein n=1 Tax=Rhizobium wenxiniae TaxID=1737357 RepID=A0A7W9Y2R7_9HYPH|nr:DUF1365 family protein [Rhizobium wenxiniae]MBB6160939.1 hypothetical protein [Rhizobium wenxiniae]GGF85201.1 DUF1365 domain-containing protein [Rhizobium wenxiniae]